MCVGCTITGMDPSSVSRLVKPSSGIFKGRQPKQSHPMETVQMDSTENDNHGEYEVYCVAFKA